MMNPHELRATLQIGKNGITESFIEELNKQLKKRKIVKIKLLRSFLEDNDRTEVALKLSNETKAAIVSLTGFALVLRKSQGAETLNTRTIKMIAKAAEKAHESPPSGK